MADTATETHLEQQLPNGTILDQRYEIVDLLGAGGFALVYQGRQLKINRPVAIKVLHAPHDPEMKSAYRERFLREAQTAAQIRHPNVVTVHDYGLHQGSAYIVMELLDGHDLKVELVERGSMDPRRLLPLFCGCLDALGEGHNLQIVHKDLKPSNLYLTNPDTRREALRILDFGIARLGGDESGRLTGTGMVLGTPKYYAPEYARSQIVTPALDVYQMGLILVEALTGQPVVAMTDAYSCLMRHCSGELDLPTPLLESPLGPVLARALALKHADRFPNAHAFRDALERVNTAEVPYLRGAAPTRSLHDYSGSAQGLVSVSQRSAPKPRYSPESYAAARPSQEPDPVVLGFRRRNTIEPFAALQSDPSQNISLPRRPTVDPFEAIHNEPASLSGFAGGRRSTAERFAAVSQDSPPGFAGARHPNPALARVEPVADPQGPRPSVPNPQKSIWDRTDSPALAEHLSKSIWDRTDSPALADHLSSTDEISQDPQDRPTLVLQPVSAGNESPAEGRPERPTLLTMPPLRLAPPAAPRPAPTGADRADALTTSPPEGAWKAGLSTVALIVALTLGAFLLAWWINAASQEAAATNGALAPSPSTLAPETKERP